MAAFEAQATPALVARCEAFARLLVAGVMRCGGAVDSLSARELVLDALEDTLEQRVVWDPRAIALELHVFNVITSRARHRRIHARRFPRASLSSPHTGALAEAEASLAQGDPGGEGALAAAREARAAEALTTLRALATGDRDVLRLLDAYAADATKKADVMRVARMSSRVYERTRKRLHTLVKKLSPELRPAPLHA